MWDSVRGDWVVGQRRAGQSLRLRLRSGLRQSGTRVRAGWLLARLKPGPTGLWLALEMGGAFARMRANAHLIDDEAVAKMGHPAWGEKGLTVWVGLRDSGSCGCASLRSG
jgi:hypothetical protein